MSTPADPPATNDMAAMKGAVKPPADAATTAEMEWQKRCIGALDVANRAITNLDAARQQIEKLQAFKDYVHMRLDDAGVPVDPESPHKAEGCRIGGRLDWLLAEGWRGECLLHRAKAKSEYWCWQGDGTDHLESLTCPVLISADKMRELIADLAAARQRIGELETGIAAFRNASGVDEIDAAWKAFGAIVDKSPPPADAAQEQQEDGK